MPFQIFLGSVFGILFVFISHVPMNSLAAEGSVVISVNIYLQRPFVAVIRCAPGVLRVVCFAPASVLPLDAQIGIFKGGRLRVGNISLTLLVYEYAAA